MFKDVVVIVEMYEWQMNVDSSARCETREKSALQSNAKYVVWEKGPKNAISIWNDRVHADAAYEERHTIIEPWPARATLLFALSRFLYATRRISWSRTIQFIDD
jgi:hypothetical protein